MSMPQGEARYEAPPAATCELEAKAGLNAVSNAHDSLVMRNSSVPVAYPIGQSTGGTGGQLRRN